MLRHYAKRIIQRVTGAGGYAIINAATLAELQQTILDTKTAVTTLRNQLLNAPPGGLGTAPIVSRQSAIFNEMHRVPSRFDAAAMASMAEAENGALRDEHLGLAEHYCYAAQLASRHWFRSGLLPNDPYPDDDFTLEFAVATNNFVPGYGNEADTDPDLRSLPWRQLFADPECGVFLVMGQSNAANHGNEKYVPRHEVYNFDFLRMRCTPAADPLAGASGNGGSVWSRLGDMLVEKGVFKRVLFVPVSFGGAFITDIAPGGNKHGRTTLALSRLFKELCVLPLPFSAVLWQQGEAESNHTLMTPSAYQGHFHEIVADLRAMGVFAPIFVAQASICDLDPRPHNNHQAIRNGQLSVVSPGKGIFAGPDIDTVVGDGRWDGCHLSDVGLNRAAELWLEKLAPRRTLLKRV